MNNQIIRIATALLCGLIFGFGLSLSGMLNPVRVQGFLDIFGAWDPTLAFVLGGAVVVAFCGVTLAKRMQHPVFEWTFYLPTSKRIDSPLIIGSALFGIGWGLAGFCPGPAIASLSQGLWQTALFVLAMVTGMVLHDRFFKKG
ncbi:YeeE/YedE family protein [Beijerinckia mobilis]|uniref:YeeE/YedE family protein n=1 Tax=Beijerinckia mobilis TaxID=231434 RepID=UPI000552B911|nr:YeeE/YedE family protein [Beijerinckia mobilis]